MQIAVADLVVMDFSDIETMCAEPVGVICVSFEGVDVSEIEE